VNAHRLLPWAWLLLGLFSTGCLTVPALVQVYKAPETELSDVQYIEVETFKVAETVAKQSGENISGPLKNELQKSKRFIIVDRVALDHVRDLNKARKEGIVEPDATRSEPLRLRPPDAILRGNVVAYKCETSAAPSGARPKEVVHEVVYDPLSWAMQTLHGFRRDELIQLEGSVAITYQLLDARTGAIRTSGESIHTSRRLYLRPLASGGEQDRLLRELSHQCVQDVANKLVRHKVTELVVFARGSEPVEEGIRQARAGNWNRAQECWEAALARDPNDHAALFDLGLAYRAHLDQERAIECFRRCAEIHASPLYKLMVESEERVAREDRVNEIELASGSDKCNLGIAFARDGDWKRAEAVWRKAVAEQPNDHAAVYNLGLARREQGDLKEACALLAQAKDLNRTDRRYQQEWARVAARIPAEGAKPAEQGAIVPVSATVPAQP
jgi:Flp pilus assembly protein TadD